MFGRQNFEHGCRLFVDVNTTVSGYHTLMGRKPHGALMAECLSLPSSKCRTWTARLLFRAKSALAFV